MFTVASYGRKLQSITHPLTRPGRPVHPFGEGLDKPRPVVLTIKGIRYEATSFQGDDGTQVVRLVKLAGKGDIWDVSRGQDGLVRCDCPSYIKTFEGTCGTCKHGSACIEAHLIEAPAPVPNPARNPGTPVPTSSPINRVAHLMPTNRPTVAKVEPVAEVEPVPAQIHGPEPVQPEPVKTAHDMTARTWSEVEWKRAEAFGLRAPAGMKRPVAIKTPSPTVEPVEVEAPTIPATAARIRVLEGSAVGVWVRQPKRGRWIHESDASSLDFSDTSRWLAYAVADAWFAAGQVEVLTDEVARPVPIVQTLDELWWSGFALGRAGIDARPCRDWIDAAQLAFMDGWYWGALQRAVDP